NKAAINLHVFAGRRKITLDLQIFPGALDHTKRDVVRVGDGGDAGLTLKIFREALVKRLSLRRAVARRGKVQLRNSNMIGLEAGANLANVPEASKKESRADDSDDGKRHLRRHEQSP